MAVRLAILAGAVGLSVCSSCFGQPGSVASEAAKLPVDNLQEIPADDSTNEHWIVWDEFAGNDRSAHLALCDPAGKCRWSHGWSDAYAPTIRLMGPWSTDRSSLFLVTYQQGAVAETAVVVGLSLGRDPVIYDQRDGVAVTVALDNATVLIDQDPGSKVVLDCLRWSDAARRLRRVHCRPVLVGGVGYLP